MFIQTKNLALNNNIMADTENGTSFLLECHPFPHFVKYMGSKTKILPFVVNGINQVYDGGGICDLFAGSCSLSGALGHMTKVHSNDIQYYSSFLAHTYLTNWREEETFLTGSEIIDRALQIVENKRGYLPKLPEYSQCNSLDEFIEIEKSNRALINFSFPKGWHLFTKYYSGTWWSAEQCLWIDAIREVAETQKDFPHYHTIISTLMYAMAYCSQGTGHYAQYRDANTDSSMKDILIYRLRKIDEYFIVKYESVSEIMPRSKPDYEHIVTTLDFKDCLNTLSKCTVYADPPYCFVHYSRFYHALETLVLYDYPNLQVKNGEIVKGRYRENRHQSPFSIRSQVRDAFTSLFRGIVSSESNLVLSYSNTGMITLPELISLTKFVMVGYEIDIDELEHTHMTMGRKNDRDRKVNECLLIARRK